MVGGWESFLFREGGRCSQLLSFLPFFLPSPIVLELNGSGWLFLALTGSSTRLSTRAFFAFSICFNIRLSAVWMSCGVLFSLLFWFFISFFFGSSRSWTRMVLRKSHSPKPPGPRGGGRVRAPSPPTKERPTASRPRPFILTTSTSQYHETEQINPGPEHHLTIRPDRKRDPSKRRSP